MPNLATEDFDDERLERQQRFFVDRSQSYDNRKDGNALAHQAAAASFLRDAASIALIRGDVMKAAELFVHAGRKFAELGLFYGYFLMVLGKPKSFVDWFLERDSNPENFISQLVSEGAEEPLGVAKISYLAASTDSPRQLLYFYQAVLISSFLRDGDARLREIMRQRLDRVSGFPIGATATPIVNYLELLDQFSHPMVDGQVQFSATARNIFRAMVLRRAEQIVIGRADKWQWGMLFNPADVVDLNLVATSLILFQRGVRHDEINALVEDENLMLNLPFRVAKLYRTRVPGFDPPKF